MGCSISKSDIKSDLKEGKTIEINIKIKSTSLRNEDVKDEFDSQHRKSYSSSVASEGGFLKNVIGSNEKERGVDRELEPNDRISIASSPLKEHDLCSKQLGSLEKDGQFIEKKDNDHDEEEDIRASNVENCSSILLSPGSPSFREYCAFDEYMNVDIVHDGEEGREETKSLKEGDKEMGNTGRRGRRRFRNAMFGKSAFGLKGGSLRKKTLLNATYKHSLPSTDQSPNK